MNIPPPPEADNLSIKDLRNWCEELYRVLQFPSFHNAYFGTVGSGNYIKVDTDGHMIMYGKATFWDDLKFPSQSTKDIPGATAATDVAYKGGVVKSFASNVNQALGFNMQCPHGLKFASDIEFHIHYALPTAGAGGGAENVKFDFTISLAGMDEEFPAQTTYTVTEDVQALAADTHLYLEVTEDIVARSSLSACGICSLTRDVSVANDYADKVYVVEVDFHVELDQLGSNTEYVK